MWGEEGKKRRRRKWKDERRRRQDDRNREGDARGEEEKKGKWEVWGGGGGEDGQFQGRSRQALPNKVRLWALLLSQGTLSAQETLHHGRYCATNKGQPASRPAVAAGGKLFCRKYESEREFMSLRSAATLLKTKVVLLLLLLLLQGGWSLSLSALGPGPTICQIQNIRFAEAHLRQIIC